MKKSELAAMIDHTLLRADADEGDVRKLCAEALAHGFASVCVNGCHVPLAAKLLAGGPVAVCAVVGFPLGASSSGVKAFEADQAARDGATEVDMVMAVGMLKQGDAGYVEKDIRAVADAVRGRAAVKVILETCLLTEAEKEHACHIAVRAGAAFVKSSTGFSGGGATEADISLMRRAVGPDMGVKASGGIRTYADALKMIRAGASRIGASASVAIVSNAND